MSKIFAGVFGTVVLIGSGMLIDTRADIKEAVAKVEAQARIDKRDSILRDKENRELYLSAIHEIKADTNEIVRVMNIFSSNQKLVMRKIDVDYVEPEEVHRGTNRWDE